MSDPAVAGRRRSSRAGDTARKEALERLKAIRRSGGRRSEVGFQVKLDEPIYDTVAEEDYEKLVAKRQEAVRGFIVDDDGLGYGDEGQEEDWACSGLPPSSDEDEMDDGGKKERKKKVVKKEGVVTKKPAPTSLSAAAAMMGKQRLSTMFTGSSFRRNERGKGSALSAESMVDDLIAEFAPDEADRMERRQRRGPALVPQSVPVKHAIDIPIVTPVRSETPNIPNDRVPGTEVAAADMEVVTAGVMENNTAGRGGDLCGEMKDEEIVHNKVDSNTIGNGRMDVVMHNSDYTESACSSKPEKKTSLNAKIKIEKDEKVASAISGWKAMCGGAGSIEAKIVESGQSEDKSDINLGSDGTLPFYLMDAHEESYGPNSGTIYIFGKVKTGSSFHSCCITVKNMQRCIYAIPNANVFQNDEIMKLEKSAAESQISKISFRTKLQEMASELKSEIAKRLINHNISSFSMMPVKRGYAFERMDIPVGEQYVLKITYPFKDPSLPSDLKGDLFNCLLGTNTSALELFLIKRKIMGPSWLTISRFTVSPPHERISWCKYEIVVDCPKDIIVSASKTLIETPPVIVTALNLKTMISEKNNANEIVSASVICCHKAKIDGPMMASDWKKTDVLSYFTILRKPEGGIFPMGFTKEVSDRNSKVGTNTLLVESSERALLNRLMIELHKLDADVLVGHNISGFDLDVLLHRAQACKVSSSMWSKIGRLKRTAMPKLTKGSSLYGSGASPGIMSCIAGRLLCDTYLSARDLLREVSYSLTELAKTQLNKDRKEIAPHDIPAMFQVSGKLLELVDLGETDAWLSLELMFHLSILPLTRQLTNISGNLWGKTLQGARAQRVEYLLLHTFHAKKYIVPDKSYTKSKTAITTKRRVNAIPDGENADNLNSDNALFDDDARYIEQPKSRKGPAYAGGLVLEPKKGLYDKIVLLLDFNSLYPSIIQEYNICFTTIERSLDGLPPSLPSSRTAGVLPEILRNLVERRKTVKSWLKNASGLKAQQLDIQQQALKLTANSMYGCLGFSNSRFYAKPIAELITLQGREILQSTVDLVQNLLNLEVIYGDTDSIMIHSGLDDISKAKALAGKVIQEVNKKYRCLEIAIDGLYKRMLLLKKKKYAAVKLQFKDGKTYEVIERKGIDIVRRDWSLLAKESGEFCLRQILSGGSCDDVVETIHDYHTKIQRDMRNGEIELSKYVITKTLTKSPEDYPDGKNQPHVQVALRLKKSGHSTGCSSGDTVPYVICRDQDAVSTSSGGIAERARHPDELKKNNGNWMIDIDYYLSQQIHPVASRLCASIQGTSPARLADCLGLDSSKFQHTTESTTKDSSCVLASVLDDDDKYHGCEPLRFSCPSCSSSFDCPPISCLLSSLNNNSIEIEKDKEHVSSFWHRIRCPRCPDGVEGSRLSSTMIANQVKRQADSFICMYYRGLMTCDDETCKYTTRYPNLRVIGDSERGSVCPNYPRCNGHLVRQYTEAELYKQLSYFCHIFDAKRCIEKSDKDTRMALEKELTRLYPIINVASTTIQKIRNRCAYAWVQLEDLTVSV